MTAVQLHLWPCHCITVLPDDCLKGRLEGQKKWIAAALHALCHRLASTHVQESLGGNAKTMLICNISPAVAFAEETQITLEFARGAKELKNRVCTAGWPLVTSSSYVLHAVSKPLLP